MAQPGREGRFEIWNAIGLLIDTWLREHPIWIEDLELKIKGTGFAEEAH